jgi:hypothetical protein
MLPAELPLSLARTVVPAPPPMAQENRLALDAHQPRTPHVMVPATMSNALASHAVHTWPMTHHDSTTAQSQTGNAAVAHMIPVIVPAVLPRQPP